MTKKTVSRSLSPDVTADSDFGILSRESFWMILLNNQIGSPNFRQYRRYTSIQDRETSPVGVYYIPTTIKSVSIDMGCYGSRMFGLNIKYKPDYEICPYIVNAIGPTCLDWCMIGGRAKNRVVLTPKPSDYVMTIIGDRTDTFVTYNEYDPPARVSCDITKPLMGTTIL